MLPTIIKNPVPDLLERDPPDDNELSDLFRRCAEQYERLVNYGTHIIKATIDIDEEPTIDRDFLLLSLQRATRLVDAASLVVRRGQTVSQHSIGRSLFELLLLNNWILAGDQEYRAKCYRYYYNYNLLKYTERLIRIEEGTTADDNAIKSSPGWAEAIGDRKRLDEAISHHKNVISSPELAAVASAASTIKDLRLYSQLDNGPANRRALAIELGRGGQYEMIYRSQSADTHGENLPSDAVHAEEGVFMGIRMPDRTISGVSIITTTYVEIIKNHIDTFLPDLIEHFLNWYALQISKNHMSISSTNLVIKYDGS